MSTNAESGWVRRIRIPSLIVLLFLVFNAVPEVSLAVTTGVAVGSVGASTPVGMTPLAGGTIRFYIPLTTDASGNYGIHGTTADSCSSTSTCAGGYLNMFLRFAPVDAGENELTLNLSDLKGTSHPTYNLESVRVVSSEDSPSDVDETSAPLIFHVDRGAQSLMLPMKVTSSPFYIQLHFTSSFLPNTPPGNYASTIETVRASIGPVSEPLALAMLGVGLLALGTLGRWKSLIASAR